MKFNVRTRQYFFVPYLVPVTDTMLYTFFLQTVQTAKRSVANYCWSVNYAFKLRYLMVVLFNFLTTWGVSVK